MRTFSNETAMPAKRVLLDPNPVLFELLLSSCPAFYKLVIKGLPTVRKGRDVNNTNKELKQPFMKLFFVLLIKQ